MYRRFGLVLVVVHAVMAGSMLNLGNTWITKLLGALIYGSTAAWIILNIDEESESNEV